MPLRDETGQNKNKKNCLPRGGIVPSPLLTRAEHPRPKIGTLDSKEGKVVAYLKQSLVLLTLLCVVTNLLTRGGMAPSPLPYKLREGLLSLVYPHKNGQGSRNCRVCSNRQDLIRKYGLNLCRQYFHLYAKDIGLKRLDYKR